MAPHKHNTLINFSADMLTRTDYGMTWTQIAKFFRKKSTEHKVTAPYVNTIFPTGLADRRTGIIENLRAFSPDAQVAMLHELCDARHTTSSAQLKKMLLILAASKPEHA